MYPPIVIPPPPERVSAVDQTGPRLVVTHITNENFKSYAGIQILGPFHKVAFSCLCILCLTACMNRGHFITFLNKILLIL